MLRLEVRNWLVRYVELLGLRLDVRNVRVLLPLPPLVALASLGVTGIAVCGDERWIF